MTFATYADDLGPHAHPQSANRAERGVKLALGLHFLICIYYFAPTLTIWLVGTGAGATLFNQVFWPLMFLISLYPLMLRYQFVLPVIVKAWPVLLVILWCAATVLWSRDSGASIKGVVRLTLEILTMVILWASIANPIRILRMTFYAVLVIAIGDILVIPFPSIWQDTIGGFRGIHGSKNVTGSFSGIGWAITLAAIMDRRIIASRLLSVGTFGLIIFILLFSNSKTPLALAPLCTIIAGSAVVLYATSRFGGFIYLVYAAVALVPILFIAFDLGVGGIGEAIFGDATFTGRTKLWAYLLDNFGYRPIQGVGYDAVWYGSENELRILARYRAYYTEGLYQAHNGYLDFYVSTGLIGLSLAIFAFVVGFYRTHLLGRRAQIDSYYGVSEDSGIRFSVFFVTLYLASFITIHNMMETSMFRTGSVIFLMTNLAWTLPLLALTTTINYPSRDDDEAIAMEP